MGNLVNSFDLNKFSIKNKDTKIKIFIEFLLREFNIKNSNNFNNEIFAEINIDFLVKSLNYYIKRQNITAKITAQNYITSITKFFNMLANEYKIKNDIFKNLDENQKLKQEIEPVINFLNVKADKEIATEEEYNKLNSFIKNYVAEIEFNIGKVYSQLDFAIANHSNRCDEYYTFISCITTRMVMVYGFKNDVLKDMQFEDIDFLSNTISVGSHYLKIDDILSNLIQRYLKCRTYILQKNKMKENILFIDHLGNPLRNSRGNMPAEKYFKIVKLQLHNLTIKRLSNRRIIDMIRSGQDICTISSKTGNDEISCLELQRLYNDAIDIKMDDVYEDIKPFDFEVKNKYNASYMQDDIIICPICKKRHESIEDNWVLVLRDDCKKYLACIDCKGVVHE